MNFLQLLTVTSINLTNIVLNKRSQMKEFILYDSIFIKYKNSQNSSMLEVRIVIIGSRKRGD